MWQDKKYQICDLFITLYEDHLVWEEGIFDKRNLTLYYTDIISVSGGDGAKLLGGTSRIEINTAGQTYVYSSTLGPFVGIEECISKINERIQFFRKKEAATAHAAGLVSNININPDNIEPTITRIDIFLEDGEWDKVTAYANAALDYFPTDYRLYKDLLLADMKCKSVNDLKSCGSSFASNGNYKKLDRYADESLKKELKGILEYIEKEPIYKQARSTSDKKKALELFKGIRGYKDSNDYITSLQTRIKEEETRKKDREEQDRESKYQDAIQLQNRAETIEDYKKALEALEELKAITNDSNTKRHYDVVNRYKEVQKKYDELKSEKDYEEAVKLLSSGDASKAKAAKKSFDKLKAYRDSDKKAAEAQAIITAAQAKTKKKILIIVLIVAICLAGIFAVSNFVHQKDQEKAYNNAIELYEAGDYEQAKELFDQLADYEDSSDWSAKCSDEIQNEKELASRYDKAVYFLENGGFKSAVEEFKALGEYSDSAEMLKIAETYYDTYKQLVKCDKEGDYIGAKEALNKIADRLDEETYEKYSDYIESYGPWVGSYEFDSGDANAISLTKNNVNKITVKVIKHELIIEYDGGSHTLERPLQTNLEGEYNGLYFVHNYDDYTLCAYRSDEDGSIRIECSDYTGDSGVEEYNGYYKTK